MSEIMLSVAIITYKHEKYIRQALDSVLMQDVNFDFEIIIGDDNSPDGTREILYEYRDKYPNKFILLLQDENVGGTKNTYDIFMNCKGKYIAILEGDDYWTDTGKLQKQVDFLEKNFEYQGVSHVIEGRDLEGNFIDRYPSSNKLIGKDVTSKLFLRGYYFSTTALVFKNLFLDKSSDYEIIYKPNKYVGDFTICMLLLDKGRVRVLEECMAVYRCRTLNNESNYNSIRNRIEKYVDHMQVINANKEYFKNKYDFINEYASKTYSLFFYCLTNGKLIQFGHLFKGLSLKLKVILIIKMPLYLISRLFHKISSIKRRYKEGTGKWK